MIFYRIGTTPEAIFRKKNVEFFLNLQGYLQSFESLVARASKDRKKRR